MNTEARCVETRLSILGKSSCSVFLLINETNSNYDYESVCCPSIDLIGLSPPSNRIHPLVALHTIGQRGLQFTLLPTEPNNDVEKLYNIYDECTKNLQTAIVQLSNGKQLHLVAMAPTDPADKAITFWAFEASSDKFTSCLQLLNLHRLAIVFDLDETLLVANTMRSFDEKIGSLGRKIAATSDQNKITAMAAEKQRYEEDRTRLWQFHQSDSVEEGSTTIQVELESLPSTEDKSQQPMRPVIRLPSRRTVLTRIDPSNRDTSVLVRMRSAWEALREYLVSDNKKRYEVFVCTMAEKEYAVEMWRLLDPENVLIPLAEVRERIVCVRSDCKKTLNQVFSRSQCDSSMAVVIDDRLNVWMEEDRPRVFVLPPYAPYVDPRPEEDRMRPVLSYILDLVTNVRCGYYQKLDDALIPVLAGVKCDAIYEDLPKPLDSSQFMRFTFSDLAMSTDINRMPISNGKVGLEQDAATIADAYHPNGMTEKVDASTEGAMDVDWVAILDSMAVSNQHRDLISKYLPLLQKLMALVKPRLLGGAESVLPAQQPSNGWPTTSARQGAAEVAVRSQEEDNDLPDVDLDAMDSSEEGLVLSSSASQDPMSAAPVPRFTYEGHSWRSRGMQGIRVREAERESRTRTRGMEGQEEGSQMLPPSNRQLQPDTHSQPFHGGPRPRLNPPMMAGQQPWPRPGMRGYQPPFLEPPSFQGAQPARPNVRLIYRENKFPPRDFQRLNPPQNVDYPSTGQQRPPSEAHSQQVAGDYLPSSVGQFRYGGAYRYNPSFEDGELVPTGLQQDVSENMMTSADNVPLQWQQGEMYEPPTRYNDLEQQRQRQW